MSSEPSSITEKTGIQVFCDEFNLPKVLGGQAGDAVAKLIGGAVAIPAAQLNHWAQGIKDKTEIRSAIAAEVAKKTAEMVVADPEVMERAKHAFVNDMYRKQVNREKVAQIALEVVGTEELPEDTVSIEDDWMNVFSSHAENASSERMRQIWGKILAGEIRKPGEFSLSTLRFMAETSKEVLDAFNAIAPKVIANFLFNDLLKDKLVFQNLLLLSDHGLLTNGPGLNLKRTVVSKPNKHILLDGQTIGLVLVASDDGFDFSINVIGLTRVAQEMLKIAAIPTDLLYIEKNASKFQQSGVQTILVGPVVRDVTGLVSMPVDQSKRVFERT